MIVRVLLFALAKQQIGQSLIEVEVKPGASIGELKNAIIAQFPKSEQIVAKSMFAQNDKYSTDQEAVDPKAEIACIPPVSGG